MPENPFSCEACDDREAVFCLYERYAADGGGAVELETPLCRECVEDTGPRHLDDAHARRWCDEHYVEKVRVGAELERYE